MVQLNLKATDIEIIHKAVQTPPLPYQLGAKVVHFNTEIEGLSSDVIFIESNVPKDLAQRLIEFGGVYFCPVPPLPREVKLAISKGLKSVRGKAKVSSLNELYDQAISAGMSDQHWHQRQVALERWGNDSSHQTPRRLTDDALVPPGGGYFRIHLHPKRFPVAYDISSNEWRRRLIHCHYRNELKDGMEQKKISFLVVNKPPGIPVVPTVDNAMESVLVILEKTLGLPLGQLLPVHRLDVGTEGLVLVAGCSEVAAAAQRRMEVVKETFMTKRYRFLVKPGKAGTLRDSDAMLSYTSPKSSYGDFPIPMGPVVHWVLEGQREVGEVAHTKVLATPKRDKANEEGSEREEGEEVVRTERGIVEEAMKKLGALRCEMILERAQLVQISNPKIRNILGLPTLEPEQGLKEEIWEVEARLITGRTHQIRVQMAALGLPLLGDNLYRELARHDELFLDIEELKRKLDSNSKSNETGMGLNLKRRKDPENDGGEIHMRKRIDENHDNSENKNNENDLNTINIDSKKKDKKYDDANTGYETKASRWSQMLQEDPLKPFALQSFSLDLNWSTAISPSSESLKTFSGPSPIPLPPVSLNLTTESKRGDMREQKRRAQGKYEKYSSKPSFIVEKEIMERYNLPSESMHFEVETPWWRQ